MMSSPYQDHSKVKTPDIGTLKQGVGGPRGTDEPSLLVISSLCQDLIKLDR
jgi:hypothetical protein